MAEQSENRYPLSRNSLQPSSPLTMSSASSVIATFPPRYSYVTCPVMSLPGFSFARTMIFFFCHGKFLNMMAFSDFRYENTPKEEK